MSVPTNVNYVLIRCAIKLIAIRSTNGRLAIAMDYADIVEITHVCPNRDPTPMNRRFSYQ